ncbi:hypothetical protein DRB17_08510 [Ferruginivarius sediminum]|uniref:Uncharacterized protein n=1 Tax=Ferruginivarius sediminum TaxID=2661937 RepID=A0A369TCZ8_9PROT|nr:hypothetical protein DRB17_08510 [Ferruginivarius sediminum]
MFNIFFIKIYIIFVKIYFRNRRHYTKRLGIRMNFNFRIIFLKSIYLNVLTEKFQGSGKFLHLFDAP